MAGKTKVGVVIVSYNSASELKACITGAFEQANSETEVVVVVVDNNSKDNSADIAEAARAITIRSAVNLGFSKGVNLGTKEAYKHGCTEILWLNPDAIMLPGSLKALRDTLHNNPKTGATGPHMVNADESPANAGYYYKAPSLLTVAFFSTHLRGWALKKPWLVKRYEEQITTSPQSVHQIPGACLLTTKSILDKIGLLDEDFAIWFEDVEWSYRARRRGYTLLYTADARVVHEGGVSFAKWEGLDKAVTFYVSMKTFFRKHKPFSEPLILLVLTANALVTYAKNHSKDQLKFIYKLWTQKRGKLPG